MKLPVKRRRKKSRSGENVMREQLRRSLEVTPEKKASVTLPALKFLKDYYNAKSESEFTDRIS
jgi:hypothetical protein